MANVFAAAKTKYDAKIGELKLVIQFRMPFAKSQAFCLLKPLYASGHCAEIHDKSRPTNGNIAKADAATFVFEYCPKKKFASPMTPSQPVFQLKSMT